METKHPRRPSLEHLGPVMELSSLVTAATTIDLLNQVSPGAPAARLTGYPVNSYEDIVHTVARARTSDMEFVASADMAHAARPQAPGQPVPKTVRFQLISPESPHTTARLPMRVAIYPHDTTESIVTTVKNFYGLYSSPTLSKGVSFEDEAGNTLIARYENFRDAMVVYVRVVEEPTASAVAFGPQPYHAAPVGAQAFLNGDDYPAPAASQHGQHISRPASRTSRRRSPSPNSGRGRRSTSASTNSKIRSRLPRKSSGTLGSVAAATVTKAIRTETFHSLADPETGCRVGNGSVWSPAGSDAVDASVNGAKN